MLNICKNIDDMVRFELAIINRSVFTFEITNTNRNFFLVGLLDKYERIFAIELLISPKKQN